MQNVPDLPDYKLLCMNIIWPVEIFFPDVKVYKEINNPQVTSN